MNPFPFQVHIRKKNEAKEMKKKLDLERHKSLR